MRSDREDFNFGNNNPRNEKCGTKRHLISNNRHDYDRQNENDYKRRRGQSYGRQNHIMDDGKYGDRD